MPLYDYKCAACGHTDEEYHSIHATMPECPACAKATYERQVSRPSGAMEREYDTPIEMHSIAPVTRTEIQAFRRRNPGVDLTPGGVPIARTRKEKLRILAREGFEERN